MTTVQAAFLRAARTAAQAALAITGTTAFSALDANWGQILSVSGGAALVSLLTSLAFGLPEAEKG